MVASTVVLADVLVNIVPVVEGVVIVTVTASVGCIVVEPDVAPLRTKGICFPYKITQRLPEPRVTVIPLFTVTGPALIAEYPAAIV